MFENRDFKFAPEEVTVGIIERRVSQTSPDDDGIENGWFRGLTQRSHGPGQNARSLRDTSDAVVRGGSAEGLKIDAGQTGQSIIHRLEAAHGAAGIEAAIRQSNAICGHPMCRQ